MDHLVRIMEDLAHARQQFVRRHTMAPFHRFFENEALYLGLVRDMMRDARTPAAPIRSALDQSVADQWAATILTDLIRNPIVLGTGGTGATRSIWDPVPVVPSRETIENSLVPMASTSGRICCICQEGWNADNAGTAFELRNCHHPFHRSCIEEWFRRSCICPVCRNDIRVTPTSNTTPNVLPSNPNPQPTPPVGAVQNVRPPAERPDWADYVDDSRQLGPDE